MNVRICLLLALYFLGVSVVCGTCLTKKKKKKTVVEIYMPEPDAMAVKPEPHHRVIPVKEVRDLNLFYAEDGRNGIDVSHYQGNINWSLVAGCGTISYAYMKATEGATLVDDTYRRNLVMARKVGLKVGSYHFYRAKVPVEEQLINMTSVVKAEEQDLLPIIDVEIKGRGISNERFITDLKRFLAGVEKHYGRKPIIYTFYNFYNRYLIGKLPGYQWMIARYGEEEPVLHDGLSYIMWQYTSSGSVPGIEGDVDRSIIMDMYSLSEILF